MKLLGIEAASFAFDLLVLTLSVSVSGFALIILIRAFIETVVPEYDPTGMKKAMEQYFEIKRAKEEEP